MQAKDAGRPRRAHRRCEIGAADVSQASMAVVDMVGDSQVVVSGSAKIFAYHKEPVVKTELVRFEGYVVATSSP